MWVTVWRHGEAAPGAIDEHRPLTARGRQSLRAVVRGFVERCEQAGVPLPDAMAFSPLVRTTQTAEILALGLGLCPRSCAALAPSAERPAPQAFLDESRAHEVIVSHQPFVSELINDWLDSRDLPPLMPGGYACIDLLAAARGGGTLAFSEANIL